MFCERALDGTIKGIYPRHQAGYAEEELPDDHPQVLAFAARQSAPPPRSVIDMLIDYVAAKPDAPQEIRDEATKRPTRS